MARQYTGKHATKVLKATSYSEVAVMLAWQYCPQQVVRQGSCQIKFVFFCESSANKAYDSLVDEGFNADYEQPEPEKNEHTHITVWW